MRRLCLFIILAALVSSCRYERCGESGYTYQGLYNYTEHCMYQELFWKAELLSSLICADMEMAADEVDDNITDVTSSSFKLCDFITVQTSGDRLLGDGSVWRAYDCSFKCESAEEGIFTVTCDDGGSVLKSKVTLVEKMRLCQNITLEGFTCDSWKDYRAECTARGELLTDYSTDYYWSCSYTDIFTGFFKIQIYRDEVMKDWFSITCKDGSKTGEGSLKSSN